MARLEQIGLLKSDRLAVYLPPKGIAVAIGTVGPRFERSR